MNAVQTVETCPLCGSAESRLFDQRRFLDRPVANRVCSRCGLVYQSPRMSDAELDAFYAGEYRRMYQGAEGPGAKDLAVQQGRAAALAGFARARLPAVSRHLDIGCSAGLLLERFRQEYGCRAVGVEPGEAYRAYASDRGLEVHPSLEALQAAGLERFDLISLAHVLEHIGDPVAYLRRLRRDFLSPDGRLLVEVPNLYAHDCFEVAHLVSYSPHTLNETLRQAGFEVAAVQRHGRPRSELLPLYLTALARPADNGHAPTRIAPERFPALRRRLGMLHRRLLTRLAPRRAWLPVASGAD